MTQRRLLRRIAVAVAGGSVSVLAAGALGPAAAHGPDPILGGGLFSQNEVLTYRWSGSPSAAMRTAIGEGVDDANTTRRSKAPTFAYSTKGDSTVYYGVDVPCGVNGLACVRRNAPDTFGVWFRENGHRFDWGTLRWCELSGSPDGCYQVENVMLDELGHVMVLDHHDNLADDSDYGDAVVQTYSRTKPRSGWNAHAFGRCDVATLQQQYDVLNSTTAYSTCLDVPTTLSLTASKTSVPVESLVTFTASLATNGSGRLSNNAVSGRVVVLQQRLSSGWSDVATMAPGTASGTYSTTVTVWTSRDYRALFRKPSGEGLRSSSSAAVTITVTSGCLRAPCPQSAPAR
jgi:hypothetical protein